MNLRSFLGDSYYLFKRVANNLVDIPSMILIYHRVLELENDPQLLAVSPDNFYEHIKWLKYNYNLLSVEEFLSFIKNNKKLPRNSVLLTFDDGYCDNFTNALPILNSLDAQAIFYISTGNIDSNEEFWWDKLENILLLGETIPPSLLLNVGGRDFNFTTNSRENIYLCYSRLHPFLKRMKFEERENIFTKLIQWRGNNYIPRESFRTMNSQEIKSMFLSKSAVLGAHTSIHDCLSILNYSEQKEEIRKSKLKLEEIVGSKISHFSYPFGGKKDYNRASVEICKELGFEMVCSNYHDHVHRWSSLFELPRILVRNWDLEYFKTKVERFFRY